MSIHFAFLEPIYYKGWIIQGSRSSFTVSNRTDTAHEPSTLFTSLEDALRYVDEHTVRHT